jgi:hypothetical protein
MPFLANFVGNPDAWGIEPGSTAKSILPPSQIVPQNSPAMPQAASLPAKAALGPDKELKAALAGEYPQVTPVPEQTPSTPADAPAGKLQPDQYDALIQALSQRPSGGQIAGNALAGLGDAIMQGVGRTSSPGFLKSNIEQQQAQKQALINALNAKYGHGIEQQKMKNEMTRAANELAEQTRSHKMNESETEKARVLTGKSQELEARRLGQAEAHQTAEEQAKNIELAQKGSGLWNALMREAGLGAPLPNQVQAPVPGSVVHHENGNYKFLGGNPSDQKSWKKVQ